MKLVQKNTLRGKLGGVKCVMDLFFWFILFLMLGHTLAQAQALFFQNVASSAGVNSQKWGHGVGFLDYNNDGRLDIYVVHNLQPNSLFHNNGNGTFTNVAKQAGVEGSDQSDQGVILGDYDNDGYIDIFLTNPLILYHNNGNGTFTNVSWSTHVRRTGTFRAAAFGDYNNDGYLDIYVGAQGEPNILYRNNGDGTFSNVAQQAGVDDSGEVMPVGFFDYDNDGYLDIYVGNWGRSAPQPNVLYRNNGDGTFTNVTDYAGVGDEGNAHGLAFGDYDNDGDLDIYITNYDQANVLYRNNGDGTFTDITNYAGVGNVGLNRSCIFADFDNDGYLDIFVTVRSGGNLLYHNNGDGTFTEVAQSWGLGGTKNAHGAASGDYDNDGDLDIYVAHVYEADRFYRNSGTSNNWIIIRTIGTMSNRSGIGARVRVVCGNLSQIREVSGGSGYGSQESLPVEFGLGAATHIDSIIIRWPSGIIQVLRNISPNQILTVEEAESIQCYQISGKVVYFSENAYPVSDVTLHMYGDISTEVVTNTQGLYSFYDVPNGSNVCVTPSKPADSDIGEFTILTYDAALVAQVAVGLRQLTDYQTIVADVDKDGNIYTYDAALIASYAVGLPKLPSSHVGEWVFIPDSISYKSLDSDKTNQNFTAILLGDVHGGWTPSQGMARKGRRVYAQLQDMEASPGEEIIIPIWIEENQEMISCDLIFKYNPTVLKFIKVAKTELSQEFNLLYNRSQGKIRIGMYGIKPLNEEGELINLVFKVIGKPGQSAQLMLERYQINDRAVKTASAVFKINGRKLVNNFCLDQNYPNPFNLETVIRYQIPKTGRVTIKIYNLLGQEIKTLINDIQQAGYHKVSWDGKNQRGKDVPSGIYLCGINYNDHFQCRRLIKLK